MSTLGKILLAVVLLGVGLVVGYELAQRQASREFILPARDLTVELAVYEKHIKYDAAIHVSVGRGDQIVWEGVDGLTQFEISIRPDPREGETAGPASPFQSGWKSGPAENGRVATGPAVEAARGHWYKATVKTTIKGEEVTLDPHIYFGPRG